MTSNFKISSAARFVLDQGSQYDSVRYRLFGKPAKRKGLRIRPSLLKESALDRDSIAKKILRHPPQNSSPPKPSGFGRPSHEKPCPSELLRHRLPVEYLGHRITSEQQSDGMWVANFMRIGVSVDFAHRTAPHAASYMAFADAKRQIDASLSGPTNKRKFQRSPVALEGAIFAKGGNQECQILELSAGGARLRCDNPDMLDGELVLYIKGFGRFRAQTVRAEKSYATVSFTIRNETLLGLLKGLANYTMGYDLARTKRRDEVRVPASIVAVCRLADGRAVPCEIIDASMKSMSLRISERQRIGSVVSLGRAKARVIRHHEQGIAVQCLPPQTAKNSRFVFGDN